MTKPILDFTIAVMKLKLPEGATIGSIVVVNYHQSGAPTVEPGQWEGRIVMIDENRIVVHFVYANYWDPPEEKITINLLTGMDEYYDVPVTDIELKQPIGA